MPAGLPRRGYRGDAMLTLHLDSKSLQVPDGTTVLEAARAAGVFIPALCDPFPLPGGRKTPPQTSCMVCVVKVTGPGGTGRMLPSCALKVTDQMRVESDTPEVQKARRTALELLISDHEGPCVAPCQVVCPAHVHIDQMLSQTSVGDWRGAIATVKQTNPFPAILGRICPELCEKGCRRKLHDGAVSIGRLEREVADRDLVSPEPYRPPLPPPTGKRVAVIGGGPAGLTAAYYLAALGHACTVFHRHAELGGALLTQTTPADLPRNVLQAELAQISALPISFVLGQSADPQQLCSQCDAVLIATGAAAAHAFKTDRLTAKTSLEGIFAAGAAAAPCKHLVHAVADGHFAAQAIDAYLMGLPPVHRKPEWSCLGPTPTRESIAVRAAQYGTEARLTLPDDAADEACTCQQADRCLRCGCGKQDNCPLRELAERLEARPAAFRGQRHPTLPVLRSRLADGREINLDHAKCIHCGRCVAITREMGEPIGLTFMDRGFSAHVGPALGADLAQAMGQSAELCAAACPTAAIMLQ
jgi:hypothetical protein